MGYAALAGGICLCPPVGYRGCRGRSLNANGQKFHPKGPSTGKGLRWCDGCECYPGQADTANGNDTANENNTGSEDKEGEEAPSQVPSLSSQKEQ